MKDFTFQTRKLWIGSLWLLIWQGIYMYIGKDLLFPSPANTLRALIVFIQEPFFYKDIAVTLQRVILGISISFVVGLILGLVSYGNAFVQAFLKPFVELLKSTPVMGVIILGLLWFDADGMPIFVCFLMCYPIVYTNVLVGLNKMDEKLLEMAYVYKVNGFLKIKGLYLPQIKPYIISALEMIVGLSFKVIIAAEVLAVPRHSMGYHLLSAKVYLETAELFAWLIVIVFLSSLCQRVVNKVLE